MRIISGKLRGKSINFLRNTITRPLKDSVRESIFNILNHSKLIKINLNESFVLDLYSGIGSFGIECLSRGARSVTFVERNSTACEVLKENLKKLSLINKSSIENTGIENFLMREKNNKYNIFFFDPPFVNKTFIENLILLKNRKIYKTNHIIIIHRDVKSKDNLDEYIDTVISRKYGRSKIIFGTFR